MFRLIKPIFRDDGVFCFIAALGHWHDIGANVPDSSNPASTERFREGMLIPIVKLDHRGEFRYDVVADARLGLVG